MDVSVVIPVLNQIYYTDLLFQDIIKNEIKPTQVILIDDGSTDDYSEIVNKYSCLNINYIRNKETMGVNYAWNMGIKISTYPIVTILNNDIIINKFQIALLPPTLSVTLRSVFASDEGSPHLFSSRGMNKKTDRNIFFTLKRLNEEILRFAQND